MNTNVYSNTKMNSSVWFEFTKPDNEIYKDDVPAERYWPVLSDETAVHPPRGNDVSDQSFPPVIIMISHSNEYKNKNKKLGTSTTY
jgi:hypothetical protein